MARSHADSVFSKRLPLRHREDRTAQILPCAASRYSWPLPHWEYPSRAAALDTIQSLSSRYKIYSDLLLVCVYAFGLHQLAKQPVQRQRQVFRRIVPLAFVFFMVGSTYGVHVMRARALELTQGIAIYKASSGTVGPLPLPSRGKEEDRMARVNLNAHFREALKEAAEENIYRVP